MRGIRPLAMLFAAAFAALSPAPAAAQMRVELRGPAAVEAAPGGPATLVFRLTNASGRTLTVSGQAVLPAGWRAVASDLPTPLAAGAGETRPVGFTVPAGARPGAYVVRYTASAEGFASADSAVVRVREIRALEVRAGAAPRFAVAGDAYTASFSVRNRGNAAARVRLSATGSRGSAARPDVADVLLGPGEERPVRVTVTPAAGPADGAAVIDRVELRASSIADTSVRAAATTRVQVVAHAASGVQDRFHRLPVEVRLRTGDAGGQGTTAIPSISGAGTLSAGGGTRVDFLARPRDPRPSLLADPGEYRLGITGRGFDVRLGDGIYALSRLTEPGRSAFGAGGSIAAGPLVASAFTARPRNGFAGATETGGFAGLRFGPVTRLGVGYLQRTGRDSGAVTTARATVVPVRGTTLDAEAGRSVDGNGTATSLEAYGSRPRISFSVRHLRADSAYPGPQRGVSEDWGSLTLRPVGAFHLGASIGRRTGGENVYGELLPILFRTPRLVRSARGEIGYGGLLTLEMLDEQRAGGRLGAEYDRESRTMAASSTLRHGRSWLQPRVELGTVTDRATGETSPARRLSLRAGAAAGAASVSASVERFQGTVLETGEVRDGVSASVDAQARLATGTGVRVSASGTRAPGAFVPEAGAVEVGVDQALPFGHRIEARARVAGGSTTGAPRTAFTVDYVVPVGVPVARLRDAGEVSGRLFDAETGQGLAGVPVRLGDRVVATDRRGRWSFGGVTPGTYYLEVDRLTAGVDRVTQRPMPLKVTVVGGEARREEVGMVRGARVDGSVHVYDFAPGAEGPGDGRPLVDAGALGGVTIELSREGETQRRVSDASGAFALTGLAPGRWRLSIDAADLPPHHYAEADTQGVHLAPGETREVRIRIVPRFRPVQIVGGGDIVIEAAPGERTASAPRPAPVPAPPSRIPAPAATVAAAPATARPSDSRTPSPSAPAGASAPARGLVHVDAEAARAETRRETAASATRSPVPVRHAGRAPVTTVQRALPGERNLIVVARRVYGDASLWPKLWVANKEEVLVPGLIAPGQLLRIPPKAPLTAAERDAQQRYEMMVVPQ
jgi:hypothetical protein